MTDYQRCPTCGAICTVEGEPEFPDSDVATMHYQPACDALVRELAKIDDAALTYGEVEANLAAWCWVARKIMESNDD